MPLAAGAGLVILDWKPMLSALLADLGEGTSASLLSARFHNTLVEAAYTLACRSGIEQIVFGGGCFQNNYLSRRLEARLDDAGFRVFRPHQIPVNDGGIALGQVAIARNLWERA
jgi:hydrogenase maturation protein HypF